VLICTFSVPLSETPGIETATVQPKSPARPAGVISSAPVPPVT